MYNELLDMGYCETCGNYVPVVEDEGSLVCAYEYAEYPELATVVGQCQWFLIDFRYKQERTTNVTRRNGKPNSSSLV